MIFSLRPVFLVIGVLLATLGISMFLPAIVDLVENNRDWEVFAFTGLLTLLQSPYQERF